MIISRMCSSGWLWIKQCYGFDNLTNYSQSSRSPLEAKTARVFMQGLSERLRESTEKKNNDFFSSLQDRLEILLYDQTAFSNCLDGWGGRTVLEIVNRVCSLWYRAMNACLRTHFCTEKEALESALDVLLKLQGEELPQVDYASIADPQTGKIRLSALDPRLPQDKYTTIFQFLLKRKDLEAFVNFLSSEERYPALDLESVDDLYNETILEMVDRNFFIDCTEQDNSNDDWSSSGDSSNLSIELTRRQSLVMRLRALERQSNFDCEQLLEQSLINPECSLSDVSQENSRTTSTTYPHLLAERNKTQDLGKALDLLSADSVLERDCLFNSSLLHLVRKKTEDASQDKDKLFYDGFQSCLLKIYKIIIRGDRLSSVCDLNTLCSTPGRVKVQLTELHRCLPPNKYTTVLHLFLLNGRLEEAVTLLLSTDLLENISFNERDDLSQWTILEILENRFSLFINTELGEGLFKTIDELRREIGLKLKEINKLIQSRQQELIEKLDTKEQLYLPVDISSMENPMYTTYFHALLARKEYQFFCEELYDVSAESLETPDDLFGGSLLGIVRNKLKHHCDNRDSSDDKERLHNDLMSCLNKIWRILIGTRVETGTQFLRANNEVSAVMEYDIFEPVKERYGKDENSSIFSLNSLVDYDNGGRIMLSSIDPLFPSDDFTTEFHVRAFEKDYDRLLILLERVSLTDITVVDSLYGANVFDLITKDILSTSLKILGEEDVSVDDRRAIEIIAEAIKENKLSDIDVPLKCLKIISQDELLELDCYSAEGEVHNVERPLSELHDIFKIKPEEYTTFLHIWIGRGEKELFQNFWTPYLFINEEALSQIKRSDDLYGVTLLDLIHNQIQRFPDNPVFQDLLDVYWQGVLAVRWRNNKEEFGPLEDDKISLNFTKDPYYENEEGTLSTTRAHLLAVGQNIKELNRITDLSKLFFVDDLCKCSVYEYIENRQSLVTEEGLRKKMNEFLDKWKPD